MKIIVNLQRNVTPHDVSVSVAWSHGWWEVTCAFYNKNEKMLAFAESSVNKSAFSNRV